MSEAEEGQPRMEEALIIRHEEIVDAQAGGWHGIGFLRARRQVETARVTELIPVNVEELASVRVPVSEGDTGQIETLPDGSISIPLFAEELVVVKRTVLRERVIIRKDTTVEQRQIEDELRREVVDIETEGNVELRSEPPTG